VKNSLRAVNDRYQDSDDPPPPIRVVVAEGGEDVTIKVSLFSSPIPIACGHTLYVHASEREGAIRLSELCIRIQI